MKHHASRLKIDEAGSKILRRGAVFLFRYGDARERIWKQLIIIPNLVPKLPEAKNISSQNVQL